MKRLVVCCDGTWKAENSSTVSNIVKIARTIPATAPAADGSGETVCQQVIYVSGPGARGFTADRFFGGAFGMGLWANLSAAYWQIALNWEPGDELFIFGFSRGAYTARSLVGLIDKIGIMRAKSMLEGHYPTALRMYRRRASKLPWVRKPPSERDWREFRRVHSHRDRWIDFLGVFDTVGALGVPGITSWRHRFHNVALSQHVLCARHALAIDDRRRAFTPCLWEVPIELGVKYDRVKHRDAERVEQVWFRGVHTDVGGGYPECGLSDASLRWMAAEAEAEGLVFDRALLDDVMVGCQGIEDHGKQHPSCGPLYWVDNLLRAVFRPNPLRFHPTLRRRLEIPGDHGVLLASTVYEDESYRPANLQRWLHARNGEPPEEFVETVPDAPSAVVVTPRNGSRPDAEAELSAPAAR
ncbi:DUF2235 domain-containing protein [Nocardia puris]|uniref:DUF2235 domain-containing protein n=1 Tax=Nocardia puris TaxID=208602 RepID=UPI001895C024|nr:DUF2235 domain-containing protein [Nocardia puris]MBF6216025.1 DUF2235 domain-containing protein [Nocardia puris]MBF6370225.1 DUF2235 domain-containing protein [Nocardia puris]MBF6463548.1 DUF2235 domain-containing protein [Nocardia puris]